MSEECRLYCATSTVSYRVLEHAANMQHGANGFTSLPKEGMLRIFSPENSMASAGSEPAILGTRDQRGNHKITEAAYICVTSN
jgi:hypothetical protein